MSISDGPAQRRSLRERLQRWLGIDDLVALVAGQRRDFDQLGKALSIKDQRQRALDEDLSQRGSSLNEDVTSQRTILATVVEQLNRNTKELQQVNNRLSAYEQHVPPIARVKRSLDEKAKRDAAQAKKNAEEAVVAGGGANQKEWPFGPAPTRECIDGAEHQWQIIAIFDKTSPPIPTLTCHRCKWLWTRGWTQPEFVRWLQQQKPEIQSRYATVNYPETPPYTQSEEAPEPRTEEERVALYHELLDRGLSDYEARGTAWPDPPKSPDAPSTG